MELINLKRILSEETRRLIKNEVAEFSGDDRFRIYFGQVHIGVSLEDGNGMLNEIIEIVCDHFRSNRSIALSKTRKLPYAKYRQLILFLARKYTDLSLKDIGNLCGEFDHATVIHSIKTTEGYLKTNLTYANHIDRIEQKILLLKDE